MKRLTKYLGVFLAGLILASPVMMVLPLQNEVHATPGPYFKTLTIQGGNTTSANYTMIPITIHSGNGTDNATDYYLQGQGAFSDFRDVSFTDELGNPLPFYPDNYPPLENGGTAQPIYGMTNLPVALEYTNAGTNYTVAIWQSGTNTLDPYISQLNHSTGNWSFPIKIGTSALVADDHGAPAIIRDSAGYFHVAFGAHGGDFQYARSTNPNDISSWTAMPDLTAAGGGTYPRWTTTPDGKIWFFYRGASGLRLTFKFSSDSGNTWSAEHDIVAAVAGNVIYSGNVVYDSTNQTMNFSWTTYNGTTLKRQNLYMAYLKLSDNNTYSMNGTNMGAFVDEAEANANAKLYSSTGAFEVNVPSTRLDNNNVPYVMANIQDGTGFHHEWTSWNVTSTNWTPLATIANTNWGFNMGDWRVTTSSNITAYLPTGGLTGTTNQLNRGGDFTRADFNGTTWTTSQVLTAQNSSYPLNLFGIVYGSNSSAIIPQVGTDQWGLNKLQLYYYDGSTMSPIIPKTYRVWVNVTNLPQSPTTKTILMYYGNPAATSTASAANTFIKYNDGTTSNFTTATLGGASVANFPIPKTLQTAETVDTDAFAYGANLSISSTNASFEIRDVRNSTGSDAGQVFYGLVDNVTLANSIGTSATVGANIRSGVFRYNNETTTPSRFGIYYVDAAGTNHYWNNTAWGLGVTTYAIEGAIDIRVAYNASTIYLSVLRNGISQAGNIASVNFTDVKAFTSGKVFMQSDMFSNAYTDNTKITNMYLRPYMNPEPQWLGSLANLSTGTSNVSINKDGVTSVNVTGIFGDIGSTPTQGWVDWGLTAGYGNTTANVTYTTNGTKSIALPTNLIPGQTYHYRFRATSAGGTSNGTDSTFTLTLPSVTTGTVTGKRYQNIQSYATVHGTTSSMGVASSAYTYFDWGYSPSALTHTETMSVISGTGSQSKEIAVDSAKTVYYQYRANVGSVNATGGVQSFLSTAQVDAYTGLPSIIKIIPLLLVLGILMGGGLVTYKGLQQREIMIASIGIVMIAVAFIGFGITFDSIKALLVR